jgi:hypothetical protein
VKLTGTNKPITYYTSSPEYLFPVVLWAVGLGFPGGVAVNLFGLLRLFSRPLCGSREATEPPPLFYLTPGFYSGVGVGGGCRFDISIVFRRS